MMRKERQFATWFASARVCLVLGMLQFLTGCAVYRTYQILRPPEVQFEKHTPEEHSDFGVVYEKAGDLKRAERQYRWAVEKNPADYVAWTNLGNVLYKRKRIEEAQDAYRHALALKPGYASAVNNLATSYIEKSKHSNPKIAVAIIEAHMPHITNSLRPTVAETLDDAFEQMNKYGDRR